MVLKAASAALQTAIASETLTIATCWKVTRKDGTTLGFTDHDQDLLVDGLTYQAAAGFTASAVASRADLSIDDVELEGVLDSPAITEEDLLAGVWDYSEIRVFLVDWSNLSAGVLKMRRGWLGEVKTKRAAFVAELHGMLTKARQSFGRAYEASCDVALGSARCGVNLASITETRAVVSSASRSSFTCTALANSTDDYYAHGVVSFTSGANAGLSMEVKSSASSTSLQLFLPMPYNIMAGDAFTIYRGCNKSFDACKTKFSNHVNFRGFPHIPTSDELIAGPDSPGTQTGEPITADSGDTVTTGG